MHICNCCTGVSIVSQGDYQNRSPLRGPSLVGTSCRDRQQPTQSGPSPAWLKRRNPLLVKARRRRLMLLLSSLCPMAGKDILVLVCRCKERSSREASRQQGLPQGQTKFHTRLVPELCLDRMVCLHRRTAPVGIAEEDMLLRYFGIRSAFAPAWREILPRSFRC